MCPLSMQGEWFIFSTRNSVCIACSLKCWWEVLIHCLGCSLGGCDKRKHLQSKNNGCQESFPGQGVRNVHWLYLEFSLFRKWIMDHWKSTSDAPSKYCFCLLLEFSFPLFFSQLAESWKSQDSNSYRRSVKLVGSGDAHLLTVWALDMVVVFLIGPPHLLCTPVGRECLAYQAVPLPDCLPALALHLSFPRFKSAGET